jgi:predicted PurR-regulated permease PerM
MPAWRTCTTRSNGPDAMIGLSSKSPAWRPGTRLAGALILLVIVAAFVFAARGLLLPVVLAWLLAYLLAPVLQWIRLRTKLPRLASAAILFGLLGAALAGAGAGVGLAIGQQFGGLVESLIRISERVPTQLQQIVQTPIVLGPWVIDLSRTNADPLVSALASILQPFLSQTGSLLATVASATASTVGVIVLAVILCFYMLVDLEGMQERLAAWAPPDHRGDFLRLLDETALVWRSFVRGRLLVGLVVGLVVAAVLAVLGVRFALVLGLIAGLLDVVPFFGPLVAGAIGVVVAFFQGSNWWGLHPLAFAGIVLGVFLVIEEFEHTVLLPNILGFSLRMRPLTVLLSAIVGASLAGVAGLLLAQPGAATLGVWLGYFYRKVAGLDPWPQPPPPPSRPRQWQWPWDRGPRHRPRKEEKPPDDAV